MTPLEIATALPLLPLAGLLIIAAEIVSPIMQDAPSSTWAENVDRFPEDRLLRLTGFQIARRPRRGQSLWMHVSGTTHTHEDAIGITLRQFGYSPAARKVAGKRAWESHTGVVQTQYEAAVSVLLECRRRAREAKEKGYASQ